ncbi:Laminin A family protein [Trichomonas vaginalis G3]|uniref:Phospholipase B-like n=1 Tax=Trichomonas vaginalis (strain ATCC PRA-98 / G3) TaxID=412133 RepID=A2F319_TRIV3|nr:phosphatidylinositol catabolic process [Trichomonas vaginalis G3]EAY00683.1 Laminin A family protein [Trichomonas vaginalis G3]KAI5513289.1 phosphatidylinositol catabolic process [Trichomonas vaginalis G3]|eukprot:XP_001313612.1 Laminin A family protein [Trichomonas vaginalis G3]
MFLSLVNTVLSAETIYKSCSINKTGGVDIVDGKNDALTAWASWEDSIEEVGWYKFHVHTNPKQPSEDQFRCAGALDGYLGQHRIYQRLLLYKDQMNINRTVNFDQKWEDWMEKNLEWTRNQVKANSSDPYWKSVGLILNQFDGLVEGYKLAAPVYEPLRMMDLLFIQSVGDVYDLETYWSKGKIYDEFHHLECTGLITITPDFKELIFGQAAWSSFLKMHQVLKEYEINAPEHPNKHVIISTRMGALASSDDFWLNDNGLMILETTNNNFNQSLYDRITTESLLTWIRVLHATWFSTSGKQWTEEFINHNSGTYNNQYVVVDSKKFVKGQKPTTDLLWVIEQLPGQYKSADLTDILAERRWFPSINVPYFEEIFNTAGYPQKIKDTGEKGDYYSYYNSSRFLIFNRNAPKVNNTDDFKKLIRYNHYLTDEYGHKDPGQQPLSRYDLRDDTCIYGKAAAFGGLDTKVTTSDMMMKNLSIFAIGSPEHDTNAPWSFGEGKFKDIKYDGLPKVWNFSWINYSADSYSRCENFVHEKDCTAVERCGWCAYDLRCYYGAKDGPYDAVCDDGWRYKEPMPDYAIPVIASVSSAMFLIVVGIYIAAFIYSRNNK